MRRIPVLTAAALALTTLLVPSTAWAADKGEPAMQDAMETVIAEYGGEQTGWNEVTWNDGDIVLELDPTDPDNNDSDGLAIGTENSAGLVTAARDNCQAGRYCVYAKIGYNGNKLTYRTCPATHTSFGALLGPIRSVKNDRTTGTIRAYNGSTVKATLTPGGGTANVSGITKLTCR